jgi:hypothetical protein
MLMEHLLHQVGPHRASFSLAHAEEWTHRALAQVHRGWCAMRGHDLLLRFEARRLSLSCADCGWESSGWVLDPPRFIPVRFGQRGVRQAVTSGRESQRLPPNGVDRAKPACSRCEVAALS